MNINTVRTTLGNQSLERTQEYLNMRTETEILHDIVDVQMGLADENLTWDGERPMRDTERERKQLQKLLKLLYTELGREPTEDEIFAFVLQREQSLRNL